MRETFDLSDRVAERLVREMAELAGVELGGSRPHDIQVHDDRFYMRLLRDGTLGLGEAYMDGWWDCEAIDEMIARAVRANLRERVMRSWKMVALVLKARLLNLQNVGRAFEGGRHYDIGNDLYEAMLDKRMAYTCAYWRDADDLDAAQEAKLELICRKLGLREGMTVLDLGCGWGSFAKFAAERYGVRVTGLAVSHRQIELGNQLCAGLPVELRLQDYREATGVYDRVVSIGLMEHVGPKNYSTYMALVDRCLAPDGVTVVHCNGGNRSSTRGDPWIHQYIFPNTVLPSVAQLSGAAEEQFVVEDLHNLGPNYDRTLMAWHANFERAWPELSRSGRYDERFYRMWRYYLLVCAGGFRSRDTQLYQLVLTRRGTSHPDCRF